MSEAKSSKDSYYFAAGVFKIDHFSAGFPELHKIAHEWAEDDGFYELIIRKVSADNYGIQFVYYKKNPEIKNPIQKYKNELGEKFGKGLYAWDFNESEGDDNEKNMRMLVLSRKLELK